MDFDPSWDALLKPGSGPAFFERQPRPRLDYDSDVFSAESAWCLAELARMVYRAPGANPSWSTILEPMGLAVRCAFDVSGTYGTLLGPRQRGSTDFGILVFRGTMRLRNWVTNFHALPVTWQGGGKVHDGFRRAILKAWDDVGAALGGVSGPLLYTGHSLGGALATVAASLHPPRAVYTFGSPRVGDAGFAESLAGQHVHRVVNHRDLVPTLPPPGGAFGFCHVGTPHHLRRPAEEIAQDRPIDWSRHLLPPGFLSDHAPVNYVAAVEQLL